MMSRQATLPQTTRALGVIRPQEIPNQTGMGPIGQNIGHRLEDCAGNRLSSSLSFAQPQAVGRSDRPIPPQGSPQQQDGPRDHHFHQHSWRSWCLNPRSLRWLGAEIAGRSIGRDLLKPANTGHFPSRCNRRGLLLLTPAWRRQTKMPPAPRSSRTIGQLPGPCTPRPRGPIRGGHTWPTGKGQGSANSR